MSKLVRTTISLPEGVMNQARLVAAAQGKSLSRFIAETLKGEIKGESEIEKVSDPLATLGQYSLKTRKIYTKRSEFYDDRLTRKMGV